MKAGLWGAALLVALVWAAPLAAHQARARLVEVELNDDGTASVLQPKELAAEGSAGVAAQPFVEAEPPCQLEARDEGPGTLSCPAGVPLGLRLADATEREQAVVWIRYPNGESNQRILDPAHASLAIPLQPTAKTISLSYVRAGFEHILAGADHLLFLSLLLLLARKLRPLLGLVSAFTLGHALTVSLAALGILVLPSPPVEAAIALSIVALAATLAARHRTGDAAPARAQVRWYFVAAFGLLHGLGFAGALRDIGLPKAQVPLALLSFNLGIELGQLAFLVVLLGCAWLIGRTRAPAFWPRLERALPYAIGSLGWFWVLDRARDCL